MLPPAAMRYVKCIVVLSLLLLLAWALSACGSFTSTGFTGGGVPIGGSRLFGHVVSAANPSTNLANVTVAIQATPAGGTERDLQMTTGQDGSFNFSNVLPGFSNGNVVITATPSDSAFQSQKLAFSVVNGHTQMMILTLPPSSFDPASAQSITLGVASPAVPTGGSIQVQAVLRDAAGKPLEVKPTLVFDGNFGMLNTDGTFSVPAGVLSGSGSITAYWYNLTPQSQQIHVDPNASQQPPSPPVLPGGQDNMRQ